MEKMQNIESNMPSVDDIEDQVLQELDDEQSAERDNLFDVAKSLEKIDTIKAIEIYELCFSVDNSFILPLERIVLLYRKKKKWEKELETIQRIIYTYDYSQNRQWALKKIYNAKCLLQNRCEKLGLQYKDYDKSRSIENICLEYTSADFKNLAEQFVRYIYYIAVQKIDIIDRKSLTYIYKYINDLALKFNVDPFQEEQKIDLNRYYNGKYKRNDNNKKNESSPVIKIERQKGIEVEDIQDNYCSIDLETTGFSPTKSKITEIGILKIRNGEIVDTYEQLINPEIEIPKFIENITGITNEMVLNAPTICEIMYDVKDFIGDDILLGHNICNFDSNFLYDNFLNTCNHIMENDFIDLYHVSYSTLPYCENHKLQTLINYLEIEQTLFHRALADAESTYLCYEKIKALINENNVPFYNKNYSSPITILKTPHVNFKKRQVSFKELVATTTIKKLDKDFDKKTFVFTGELKEFTRAEACTIVIEGGGIVKSGVSKEIDYLVNSNIISTTKVIKANELIAQGYPIKIITENDFMEMINNNM